MVARSNNLDLAMILATFIAVAIMSRDIARSREIGVSLTRSREIDPD